MSRRRQVVPCGLWLGPVVTAAALYAPTLRFGFVWDDPLVLEQLEHIRRCRDLLVVPAGVPHFYYRPITFLSLLLDHALGGGLPAWFHASVVLAHAVATGLVFALLRELFGGRGHAAALAGSLLFAVHPVHVESVAWIAGRSDVLATALLLAGLLVWLRRGSRAAAAGASALVLAGALAKEVAIAGILLLPAAEAVRRGSIRRDRLPFLAAAGLAALGLRAVGLGSLAGAATLASLGVDTVRDIAGAMGWYVAQAILPWQQVPWVPAAPSGGIWVSIGVAALAASIAAVVHTWRHGQRRLALAVAWYWITLAPSLAVTMLRSASSPVADRYLYLPSVALSMGVAAAVERTSGRGRRLALAAVLIAAAAGAATAASRASVWENDLRFWTYLATVLPDEPLPRRERAAALLRRGDMAGARAELETAIRLATDPADRAMGWTNLGNLALRAGDLDAAERAFLAALQARPHPFALNGLARVMMRRAQLLQEAGDTSGAVAAVRRARTLLRRSVAADPADARAHALLGQVLLALGDRHGAEMHFRESLRLLPDGPVAAINRRYLRQLGAP